MPFAGITSRLRDLLIEGSEEGEEGEEGDSVKNRLQALEEATSRIEHVLGKLCEVLDDRPKQNSIAEGEETGTMDDLDVSGTADVED